MNYFWQRYWYFVPIVILSLICCFAILRSLAFILRFPEKYSRVIFLFYVVTLLQIFVSMSESFLYDKDNELRGKSSPTNISAFIYAVFEYQVYAYLLLNFLKSPNAKKYLRITRIIVFVLAIILWLSNLTFVQSVSYFTLTEGILILPACFKFFYEILTGPPLLKLNREPSFWIVTGIVFLFVCLIPTYIGIAIIQETTPIAIIDYLGYGILIVLFLKGITCKTVQTA